ncbi:DUF86 domain-containing protein [Algoriphagus confluentis]|uniref:DUF86 domain-containing protein n=1 Tax=Algoriphagus confluentis TaxID=1697556 RepID=A0ABQ6PMI0_9BACT|nr:hypothetical protein Aconfl_18230 [Algoriphagus confluentis]
MTEKEKKWMLDLINAIGNIENFMGKSSFEDYLKDFKTQSAVERQLGIIGEVLSKPRNSESKLILSESEKIIGLRNRIIHAYDGIDQSIIWKIIKSHLPSLKMEVQKFI